jgi:hypothetical protein
MRRTINIPHNDVKPAMNRSAEKQPNSIFFGVNFAILLSETAIYRVKMGKTPFLSFRRCVSSCHIWCFSL